MTNSLNALAIRNSIIGNAKTTAKTIRVNIQPLLLLLIAAYYTKVRRVAVDFQITREPHSLAEPRLNRRKTNQGKKW